MSFGLRTESATRGSSASISTAAAWHHKTTSHPVNGVIPCDHPLRQGALRLTHLRQHFGAEDEHTSLRMQGARSAGCWPENDALPMLNGTADPPQGCGRAAARQ
jgi:hypothetical protein